MYSNVSRMTTLAIVCEQIGDVHERKYSWFGLRTLTGAGPPRGGAEASTARRTRTLHSAPWIRRF